MTAAILLFPRFSSHPIGHPLPLQFANGNQRNCCPPVVRCTCNGHVYSLGALEQDQPRDTPGSPDRARGIPTGDARRRRFGSAVACPRDATTPPDARGASDDDGRGATASLVDESQP